MKALFSPIFHIYEELLLSGTDNRYGIYQIDHDGKGREYSFINLDFVKNHVIRNQAIQYYV